MEVLNREAKERMKSDEVPIGGSNLILGTYEEYKAVNEPAEDPKCGESNFVHDADGNVVAWLDKSENGNHLSLSCDTSPEDHPGRPLTVEEILSGDGSGGHPMGIMPVSESAKKWAEERLRRYGNRNRADRRRYGKKKAKRR